MKKGRPQAKDIADTDALAAVIDCMDHAGLPGTPIGPWHGPASRWSLADRLGFPDRVVLAKMRALIRRGLVKGCACGCRGDFEPTDEGKSLIGGANCIADRLERVRDLAKEFYP